MRKHDWHPKIVEDYLEKYYKNIGTRDTCRVFLKLFFQRIGIEPKKFINLPINKIENLLFKYAEIIEDHPKKTQMAMLSIIKKFLIRNEINIKEIIWEDLKIRNNLVKAVRAITRKETPTGNDIKKILSYASNVKSKCLFVLCACSGLRIDEALQLTFDDIDMEKRKITLIEQAKFEIPRYTFFTPEAQELLKLWIPEREEMLEKTYKKSKFVRESMEKQGYKMVREDRTQKHYKKTAPPYYEWVAYKDGKKVSKENLLKKENRIFPFCYISAERMWIRLLEKAGEPYNKKDNNPKLQYPRYLYNIHSLRRFFFTQLMFDRMQKEYVDFLGGHMSELDATYKFDNAVMSERLKEEYEKHMGCLSIFEAQPDLSGMNKEMKELKKENEDLKLMMQELKAQITEMRLERLERENNIKK